jgi:hypothetical protein
MYCSSGYCSVTTVEVATVSHLGLGFDYLGAKSSLCIYKWREGGRCESSCLVGVALSRAASCRLGSESLQLFHCLVINSTAMFSYPSSLVSLARDKILLDHSISGPSPLSYHQNFMVRLVRGHLAWYQRRSPVFNPI